MKKESNENKDNIVPTEKEQIAEETALKELGIVRIDFPTDVLHIARKYAGAEKTMSQGMEDPDDVYEKAYKKYILNYIEKQKEFKKQKGA